MSPALHDRFFAHVDYSTDADVTWPSSRWSSLRAELTSDGYESRLRSSIARATPLTNLSELTQLLYGGGRKGGGSGGGGGRKGGGGSGGGGGEAEAEAETDARQARTDGGVPSPRPLRVPSGGFALWCTQPPRGRPAI